MIEVTRKFYITEASRLASDLKEKAVEFMARVEQRIDEEEKRSDAVLPPQSRGEIQKATERAFLLGRLEWIATDGECLRAQGDI
jgi:negative regulator of sigma E activity